MRVKEDRVVILVLEDSDEIAEVYAMQAAILGVEVSIASDIPTAQALYDKHRSQVKVIVLDGKINGLVAPTCLFANKLRVEGFQGKMIAASLNPDTNNRLMKAGCDVKAANKYEVIGLAGKIQDEQNG